MTKKLTVSIDNEVIEKAKSASRRRGKSLSRIIEEHLRAFAADDAKLPSGVKAMSGALKDKLNPNLNVRAAKSTYLKKKYGL